MARSYDSNRSPATVVVGEPAGELFCPACGSQYLHHGEVRVFSRAEDSDGVLTKVRGEAKVTIEPASARECPGRRGALEVDFYCEECGTDDDGVPVFNMTLRISQHKGCTYLEWV